jgi:hypothetical protein
MLNHASKSLFSFTCKSRYKTIHFTSLHSLRKLQRHRFCSYRYNTALPFYLSRVKYPDFGVRQSDSAREGCECSNGEKAGELHSGGM